jgi:outer membrane protein TolC
MRWPVSSWRVFAVCLAFASGGCVPTQPFYLHEDGDLSTYIDKATKVEYPDTHTEVLLDVAQSERPLSVFHPDFKEFWDLTLEECVSIALQNSKVLRGGQTPALQNGQLSAGTREGTLVEQAGAGGGGIGAGGFSSTYDTAIVESNPGQQIGGVQSFLLNPASIQAGNSGSNFNGSTTDGGIANVRQGVEAALAQFDTQLLINGGDPQFGGPALFSSFDRPQNVRSTSSFFPQVLNLHSGGMDVILAKKTAEGTVFSVTSSTDYNEGNSRGFNFADPATGTQPFLHTWTQLLQLEARQPLLRGRGAQINRMPVIISRIGTDIQSLAVMGDLQETLGNLEIRYWDLYLAYRNLETAKVGRDSALVTWRIVYDKVKEGAEPVQLEAQAQEQYYNFRAQVETAVRSLYDAENELRFLMGLTATDGRLVRPKDDPTLARVEFDWCEVLAEAVARRPELIQRRWLIKQREMELILARNQLLPQLDIGAQYRFVGVGNDLIHANRDPQPFPTIPIDTNAFQSLTGGQFQEMSFLAQFQMPIGFRQALAGVRHAQLRMAREKAFLEDMELDVSHGLAHSLRNLETNFQLAQTNANRWTATERDVNARNALYEFGRSSLDDVLEAQRRRAVAQQAFWTAVVEYNKSIADLHVRKGSIMDYDGIVMQEGPWPQKAYWDALGRARQRDAGWYIDYGWTRPRVISRGPIPQGLPTGGDGDQSPTPATTEELPSAEPTPAQQPVDVSDIGPLPPPTQETRVQPRATAARPTVAPAAYLTEATVERGSGDPARMSGNPLRGNQPIGTGVR